MSKRRHTKGKGIKGMMGAVVVAGIVASSAYAFTATTTVNASQAGDGTGAVTGGTVTPTYQLLGSDASKVTSITLTFASGISQTGTVKVRAIVAGTWQACVAQGAGATRTVWLCSYASGSEPNVSAIGATLEVVAVDS
jgi:hypothetical protein